MAEPFLVVGAMKSGTTTMYELLRRHPDVELVAEKERSELSDPTAARGLAQKIRDSRAVAAGEVSAGYMQRPLLDQPLETARDLLGRRLKVVAILRDPIDRAASHWAHLTQLGAEVRPLEEALVPGSPYLEFSRYHHQLSGWLDLVGHDHLRAVRLEDFEQDPVAVAQQLWDLLGVPAIEEGQVHVHANAGEKRVVATTWRRRVALSPVYRGTLRSLLPPAVRRGALAVLGGAGGRVEADLSAVAASRVRRELSSDLDLLRAQWPHLEWA